MGEFVQAFRFFAGDIEVIELPAWDCLPYDRLSPTASVSAERMASLTKLACREPADSRPTLVVTTVAAATQRTPPREVTCGAGFEAKVGLDLDTVALERYFAANGYLRASTVSERGEFAVRGGVGRRLPARLRGAGAPGHVRFRAGIDPHLRSGHPALDGATDQRLAGAGVRGPAHAGSDLAVPHRLSESVRRRRGRSPLCRGQRGRAAPRHGALAAAALRPAGDPVRLSAGRSAGLPRQSGRGLARRALDPDGRRL